jgi:hypothetical protein
MTMTPAAPSEKFLSTYLTGPNTRGQHLNHRQMFSFKIRDIFRHGGSPAWQPFEFVDPEVSGNVRSEKA